MSRLVFLVVLTVMPHMYHSLGFDFSSLIGSHTNHTGKDFNELCEYFCDEDDDYSDDLFKDLVDEGQPRILCWICHKKGLPTKSPTSTTAAPTKSSSTTVTGKTTSTVTPTTTTTAKTTTSTTTTTPSTTTSTTTTTTTTITPNTTMF